MRERKRKRESKRKNESGSKRERGRERERKGGVRGCSYGKHKLPMPHCSNQSGTAINRGAGLQPHSLRAIRKQPLAQRST